MSAIVTLEAGRALIELAAGLREDDTDISPHVHDSDEAPAFGLLVAAGPRAESAAGEYALIVETVREGYLLHYGEPRVVRDAGADLSLLAGDYLYALGLERLSALGDLDAVRELSDLISLCAATHSRAHLATVNALWLAAITAIAAGGSEPNEAAKAAARDGSEQAAASLWESAVAAAAGFGLEARLADAAQAIGFAPGGSS